MHHSSYYFASTALAAAILVIDDVEVREEAGEVMVTIRIIGGAGFLLEFDAGDPCLHWLRSRSCRSVGTSLLVKVATYCCLVYVYVIHRAGGL